MYEKGGGVAKRVLCSLFGWLLEGGGVYTYSLAVEGCDWR